MTEADIHSKILDAYKEFFEKEHRGTYWINYFIEEFKIDPFDLNSFVKPIKKLKEERKTTVIPEPIEIKSVVTGNVQKNVPVYENYTEEEANKIRTEWINLDQHLRILTEMRDITKYNLRYSEPNDDKSKDKDKGDAEQQEQSEGTLISSILDIILGNDLKKYSLRKMETALKKTGFNIDHSTLQTKFKNEKFQFFLIAGIMRKKGQVKKEIEKEKLQTFENWFNAAYMKVKGKNKSNKVNASEGKEEPNDFVDNIELD